MILSRQTSDKMHLTVQIQKDKDLQKKKTVVNYENIRGAIELTAGRPSAAVAKRSQIRPFQMGNA